MSLICDFIKQLNGGRTDERDRHEFKLNSVFEVLSKNPTKKQLSKKTKKIEKKNGFKVGFLPSFGPIVEYTI